MVKLLLKASVSFPLLHNVNKSAVSVEVCALVVLLLEVQGLPHWRVKEDASVSESNGNSF